jgi:hypothetical protein
MSKAKVFFIVLLIGGLGGLSFYLNRDSFAPDAIQISHRVSPWLKPGRPGAKRANDLGEPVAFTLNGFYRLTSVKVVIASEIATNKYAHPVWHLISESNSVPVSVLTYGGGIRGLHSAVKGARPDPLVPGVDYRLLLTTDKDQQGQHDFCIEAKR